MGFSPVLLCCTAVLRATAVLLYSTRWVGGSVRGCVHGFVRGWMRSGCVGSYYVVDGVLSFRDHVRGEPVFFLFFGPLYRPRAGIVRRTTSPYYMPVPGTR